MKNIIKELLLHVALIGIVLTLITGSAFAGKPNWAGGDKSKEGKTQRVEKNDQQSVSVTFGFGNDSRRLVNEYYGNEKRKGKCTPGLKKKNNGCQPPGQAKKWKKGSPLATDVKYYELPRELHIRLPAPPLDHKYVRVAGDILMIAMGTGMVVDAIEDIMY
jgi:Ni/Co efflux regulator RcnB